MSIWCWRRKKIRWISRFRGEAKIYGLQCIFLLPHKIKVRPRHPLVTNISKVRQLHSLVLLPHLGTTNCFYLGHWMSLHCKGIKSLQWKSFWWLLWTDSSSPMKSSMFITSLMDFIFVFSFAWSYWWLLWFCSIFEFSPWWMPQWPAIKQVPTITLSPSHLHPFLLTDF